MGSLMVARLEPGLAAENVMHALLKGSYIPHNAGIVDADVTLIHRAGIG